MLPAKSLYIHIPFCRSKCAYCDFFSIPSSCVPDLYVESLISEFRFHVQQGSIQKLETVYIGGGTPSLLSSLQIKRILDEINRLDAKLTRVDYSIRYCISIA